MRIADILLREEDGDGCHFHCSGVGLVSTDGDESWVGAGCVGGADYLSPRRVIRRWLKRLREKKATVGKIVKAKERVESGDGSVPTRRSTNWSTSGNELSSSDGSGPSGSCGKETSFNMGVGASLLYLIATSKNELNKMTELRTQMENFLQVSKEELRRRDVSSKLSEPHDNAASDIPEGSNSNSNLSVQFSTASSYAIPESETTLEFDRSSKPEHSAEGMSQLEEELEAELERLQLNLETETWLEHQRLQRHGLSSDPREAGTEEYNGGVPPYVLERRLHELLESRQEDHIQELEAALKCYQQKLCEKEDELSWWRDTISQHILCAAPELVTSSGNHYGIPSKQHVNGELG